MRCSLTRCVLSSPYRKRPVTSFTVLLFRTHKTRISTADVLYKAPRSPINRALPGSNSEHIKNPPLTKSFDDIKHDLGRQLALDRPWDLQNLLDPGQTLVLSLFIAARHAAKTAGSVDLIWSRLVSHCKQPSSANTKERLLLRPSG
jgi:hypothetical protein